MKLSRIGLRGSARGGGPDSRCGAAHACAAGKYGRGSARTAGGAATWRGAAPRKGVTTAGRSSGPR